MRYESFRNTALPTRVSAILLACALAMLCGAPPVGAQLPPLPPLPPILPPLPPVNLSLGPPALPRIPSLPQVLPANAPSTSGSTQLPVTSATLEAKLLILSADGTEPVLAAIRQAADHAGIPYTLHIASRSPGGFTPALLSDGDRHAYFQGVVLTTGTLAYFDGAQWTSAFTPTEWQTLWDYQARFRVRTVIAYAYPTPDLGFGPATGVDASATPVSARLTAAGQTVFPYVNATNPLVITRAWTYLAPAAGTGTNVLLSDEQNHALALVRTYPDGREVLSTTFDGNFFLVHSLALTHGLLNWVTGGLFLGARHVYMSPQIDDIFIDNDMYAGGTFRLNGVDWAAMTAWQSLHEQHPMTKDLRLHMAFNGEGTTGTYPLDTLTPAAALTDAQFPWINHTYTHENLDAVSYDVAYREIARNHEIAASMGLADYDPRALVTPDISGLSSPDAMRAAYDAGVRYLVTDTSRPGMDNPTPQAGIPNPHEPRILMIPRRPVNLFYNVSTPSEWTTEYNQIYRGFWGRDLTYTELLDKESDVLLQYLLRGEVDPWMFHQANLRAYDGVHSLLGDLIDRTLEKYRRIFVLPIRSPSMAALGEWTDNRMRYNVAGVRCSFTPSDRTVTVSAAQAVVVPVTGLCADSSETYGGQCIGYVRLRAGQSVSFNVGGTISLTPEEAGRSEPPASAGESPLAPTGPRLHANRPNPFHSDTEVRFELARSARVELRVLDVAGRLVRVLASGTMPAGDHRASWDGRDERGSALPGGIYFCELRAGDDVVRRRMALVR